MSSLLDLTKTYSYLLGETDLLAGAFQYRGATDSWTWSAEVFRMHGFEPQEIVPTTALILAHKHPEDREAFRRLLTEVRGTGRPVVSHHRILDATSTTRVVLMIAEASDDLAEAPHDVHGFFIDLTDVRKGETRDAVKEAVGKAVEHRATIEQAKGVLMAQNHVDADQAFGILSSLSQDMNVKLAVVAERLVALAVEKGL